MGDNTSFFLFLIRIAGYFDFFLLLLLLFGENWKMAVWPCHVIRSCGRLHNGLDVFGWTVSLHDWLTSVEIAIRRLIQLDIWQKLAPGTTIPIRTLSITLYSSRLLKALVTCWQLIFEINWQQVSSLLQKSPHFLWILVRRPKTHSG